MALSSVDEHRAWLGSQAALPRGFRVGTARFEFVPVEVHKPSAMTLTLIALERPTDSFAAVFTKNAFPGAPVIIGRARVLEDTLGAVIVNNKISNVCAPEGIASSERVSAAVGAALGLRAAQVLPCSTGVIGWRLPVDAMTNAVPAVVQSLQGESILPAAEGIVTTDLYPKIRRASVGEGSIVGIAKGAGMIEPNLATMLVYLLTDCDVDRDDLRAALREAVDGSFNVMSIDSDTSTSDTVAVLSSRRVPCELPAFRAALAKVCHELMVDIVRNGEGVHHVVRVDIDGAPTLEVARGIGKSIVNSPLLQCAIAGNDPNVGRLVMAIGKYVGAFVPGLSLDRCTLRMAGQIIFANGTFRLSPEVEEKLVAHLRAAELYASVPPPDGLTFVPARRYPAHERNVEIRVSLGAGDAACTIHGSDRTHEYISENADYRS